MIEQKRRVSIAYKGIMQGKQWIFSNKDPVLLPVTFYFDLSSVTNPWSSIDPVILLQTLSVLAGRSVETIKHVEPLKLTSKEVVS